MSLNIVIIGGVAAGMSAASKIRRLNKEAQIDVFTQENHISYAACGIPYYLSGKTKSLQDLVARSYDEFQSAGINVHLEHEAIDLIPDEKKVLLKSKDGQFIKEYDKLLLATGASARLFNFPGLDLKNIFTLRNLTDGLAIKEALDQGVKRAVIVGAGYIGVEMTETFKELGIETVIVEAADRVLVNFDLEISDYVKKYLEEEKVELFLNQRVESFEGESGYVRKVITENGPIECDLVLLTLGSIPNSELARKAGLELTKEGAILVNKYMETSLPDIYAAGDCASHWHLVKGKNAYIPLGTTANKQGRIAGTNMAGGRESFSGIAGTAITKISKLGIARTGLSKREAKDEGIEAVEVFIEANDIARYYPGQRPVVIKMIADKKSKKLIGAQIAGEKSFAKRIDVLALAVQNGITVKDLAASDLAYAPPFAPVWDPFLIAAGILKDKLEG